MKDIFIPHEQKDEIPKNISYPLLEIECETSFSESIDYSTCPPGLYCVIDDFLTEYDLRLLEEEERAEMVANRPNHIQH